MAVNEKKFDFWFRMGPTRQSPHHREILSRLGAHRADPFDTLDYAALVGSGRETIDEMAFEFTFRGVPFQAQIRKDEAGGRLSLTGLIGQLPFSVQAPLARRQALQIIAIANSATALSFETTPFQELVLKGESPLECPLTPTSILTGITCLLVQAGDYLDLILDVLGRKKAAV